MPLGDTRLTAASAPLRKVTPQLVAHLLRGRALRLPPCPDNAPVNVSANGAAITITASHASITNWRRRP